MLESNAKQNYIHKGKFVNIQKIRMEIFYLENRIFLKWFWIRDINFFDNSSSSVLICEIKVSYMAVSHAGMSVEINK